MQVEHRTTKVTIIGGGPQGIMAALGLSDKNIQDFVIIDGNALMGNWKRSMEAQQVDVLRTPNAIHMDVTTDGKDALLRFADDNVSGHSCFTLPASEQAKLMQKPAEVSIFNQHADHLITKHNVDDRWVQGWCISVEVKGKYTFVVTVAKPDGTTLIINSSRVIVAPGIGKPNMPNGPMHPNVMHSEQVDTTLDTWDGKDVCVVGGGLTGGTIATKLYKKGATIRFCTRGSLSVGQLEADHAWLPEEVLHKALMDLPNERKVERIDGARVGNGVTPAVMAEIMEISSYTRFNLHEGETVRTWGISESGKILLPDSKEGFDVLVCATGYHMSIHDLGFLDNITPKLKIFDGLPSIDKDFEASETPGLHFMGRLGELQSGPLGRNLPGGAFAARQISSYIRQTI